MHRSMRTKDSQQGRATAAPATVAAEGSIATSGRPNTTRELFDSLLLFGLTATSLGAYVGIAFAAVKLLGAR